MFSSLPLHSHVLGELYLGCFFPGCLPERVLRVDKTVPTLQLKAFASGTERGGVFPRGTRHGGHRARMGRQTP